LRDLLKIGSQRRRADPVDEMACRLLERKLNLLARLPAGPPHFEPHWVHRDYTARNLLFDDRDEVIAVLDFDEVRYTSRGYEVMRCLDHGFPPWSREGLAFFESYAAATRMTADEARDCAWLFCYVSTFSTWPMRSRYLEDEAYVAHWDEFIRLPEHPWDEDPGALADSLAGSADSLRE
jgi:Ser/Thr protein kinase RdoA (MazF antagonist)